jgi:hypothetical protein
MNLSTFQPVDGVRLELVILDHAEQPSSLALYINVTAEKAPPAMRSEFVTKDICVKVNLGELNLKQFTMANAHSVFTKSVRQTPDGEKSLPYMVQAYNAAKKAGGLIVIQRLSEEHP